MENQTVARTFIDELLRVFELERWHDGTVNGAFVSLKPTMAACRATAKHKYQGTLMSRNGGVRYVYQFPDMSRVCIGPFKHWMRVKELPAGLSAQEAYEMARFASQFEAKSGVEYKTDE